MKQHTCQMMIFQIEILLITIALSNLTTQGFVIVNSNHHHRHCHYNKHDENNAKHHHYTRYSTIPLKPLFSTTPKSSSSSSTTTTTNSPLGSTSSSSSSSFLRDDQIDAIEQFATHVQMSLEQNDFESFVLNGRKAPKRRLQKKGGGGGAAAVVMDSVVELRNDEEMIKKQKENMRGSVRLVQGRLIQLRMKKNIKKKKRKKTDDEDEMKIHLQVTFKYHGATDIVSNWDLKTTASSSDENDVRRRIIGLLNPYDVDSFKLPEWQVGTNKKEEIPITVDDNNDEMYGFQSGELKNISGSSWKLDLATTGGGKQQQQQPTTTTKSKRKFKKASCKFVSSVKNQKKKNNNNESSSSSFTNLSHDQPKNTPLPSSAKLFRDIGLTDVNGKTKVGMSSKLRQCQKFVEILSRLIDQCTATATASSQITTTDDDDSKTQQQNMQNSNDSMMKKKRVLRTIDMGCGRGYLTFSLHHHLMQKFAENDFLDVETRGIDVRPKLVKDMNVIAKNGGYHNIYFTRGSIEDAILTSNLEQPQEEEEEEEHHHHNNNDTTKGYNGNNDDINVLIALHACDTATDDSIWYGIQRNASIIVTAPCCHKEVRGYLDAHLVQQQGKKEKHPLADLLRHNIYKERIAETVTDSMRALLLEIANYTVQVFEFIGGEHTSKNVMITAVKRTKPRTPGQIADLRYRLKELASLHGVTRQRLAEWMHEALVEKEGNNDIEETPQRVLKTSEFSRTGMPKMTENDVYF